MIPDNVEKIIMTKEDYDRNVEQLLIGKIKAEQEIERLNNIINKAIDYLREIEMFEKKFGFDGIRRKKLLNILQGSDKEC